MISSSKLNFDNRMGAGKSAGLDEESFSQTHEPDLDNASVGRVHFRRELKFYT